MRILQELRQRGRLIAPQALLACLVGYFVYHAINGDHGLLAWLRLEQDLERAQAARLQLAEEHGLLAHKVGLLQPEHLDPDLLDEQARRLLNYGHRDDLVVILRRGGLKSGD